MKRLNFTQMVNKNLRGQEENKFLNFTQIGTGLYKSDKYAAKIKQAKERLNLDAKINNIIFNVHEKLREQQSLPSNIKAKPKPTKTKLKIKIKSGNQINPVEGQTVPNNINSLDNIECKNISLPRMKVLCSKKHFHKSTETSSNYISFEDHKRMMGAVQRQDNLQNMLKQHKRLKENRQSLVQDIFAMRHSLDDLQHRVNNCLQQLKNKKTYCECHSIKKTKSCKKCNEKKN